MPRTFGLSTCSMFVSLKDFHVSQLNLGPNRVSIPQKRNYKSRTSSSSSQDPLTSRSPPTPLPKELESLLQAAENGIQRIGRILTPPPPDFPPGPPGDVALQMVQNPLSFIDSLPQQYGDVVGLLLGGERVVLVTDPDIAKQVLVDEPEIYIKQGTAFFPGSSLAGNGLLVSDGAVWRRQRQLSTPAFRKTAIDIYADAMVAETSEVLLQGRWRRAPIVRDVYADFNELTLAVVLRALFGTRVSGAAAKEVTDAIKSAFEFFAQRAATAFIIPEAVPTPDNLKFGAAVARLDKAVYSLISQRRFELESTTSTAEGTSEFEIKPRDLLDSLLLSKDESGQGMSDRALRDELMTLLVAGQETSAILLGWTCAFLAENPVVQRAAYDQVRQVLGDTQLPRAEDVRGGGLQYLEAVVLEALRVAPPAYLVGRCACKDTTLNGFKLPQGTTVLVSPYVIHRDSRWWGSTATTFSPERWSTPIPSRTLNKHRDNASDNANNSSGTSETKPGIVAALSSMGPNGAYFPFGAGQRNCIGTGFAMMEAVLVLAMVLQKYELVRIPGSKSPEPDPKITLRPKQVRLLLRKRKTAPAVAKPNDIKKQASPLDEDSETPIVVRNA